MPDLLTDDELRALALTAELYDLVAARVIGRGPSRGGDVVELAMHVHAIQNMIAGQAAARAYPDRFRVLGGGNLNPPTEVKSPPYVVVMDDGKPMNAPR